MNTHVYMNTEEVFLRGVLNVFVNRITNFLDITVKLSIKAAMLHVKSIGKEYGLLTTVIIYNESLFQKQA